MKSCFGMLVAILLLVVVLGTLGGIYYLSATTEFSEAGAPGDRP
jgi:hypothetical protein